MLVIPRAHSADLLEVPAEDLAACAATARELAARAKDLPWVPGPGARDEIAAAAEQLQP